MELTFNMAAGDMFYCYPEVQSSVNRFSSLILLRPGLEGIPVPVRAALQELPLALVEGKHRRLPDHLLLRECELV